MFALLMPPTVMFSLSTWMVVLLVACALMAFAYLVSKLPRRFAIAVVIALVIAILIVNHTYADELDFIVVCSQVGWPWC